MTGNNSHIDWPAGFQRTPANQREPYPNNFRVDTRQAFENVLEELQHRRPTSHRIETAASHLSNRPNIPHSNSNPDDPGVVAYYKKGNNQYAVPCDQWDNIRDNAQAIAKYLNAKRSLEFYGVQTVEDSSEMDTQIYTS